MDNSNYFVEFSEGNSPLIISVPHGGSILLDIISRRTSGILGIDKNTVELTKKLIEKLTILGKRPSYVICKVHRSKIDLNRPETSAFNQESPLAKEIYRMYHEKIKEYISTALTRFPRSLLIDIHGFENNKRPQGFKEVEIALGTDNLKSLFSEPVPKRLWDRNIRGKIIKKFVKLGIPIAPGLPKRKEYILSGGLIIQQYGATSIVNSQAIQIEFSDNVRMYDKNKKKKVIDSLSEILSQECDEIGKRT